MKRPNGDGYLHFATLEDVTEAMKYDRKYMGKRNLLEKKYNIFGKIFCIQVVAILNSILIHHVMHH
jgi:hypothetical protein